MSFLERFIAGSDSVEATSEAEGWAAESKKYADLVQIPETTWKDVGNVALDFTPIIGDIKGGYETVAMIGEELDKENPNWYLIGAMGGLGAVATIIGLVPGAGDAAATAIMSGAKMMRDSAGTVVDAVPKYDPNTLGSMGGNMFADRKPVNKANKGELDPAGLSNTRLDNYADEIPKDNVSKGNLIDKKPLTIEELQENNAVLMTAQGDRAATDETLYGVGDVVFDNPVDLQGGRGFMRNPYTGLWASDDKVAGGIARLSDKIADDGGTPYVTYASMAGQSGDFNTMMSDTVMELINKSEIKPQKVKEYDAWVTNNVDPEWPGILNSETKEYLNLLPEDGGMGGTKRRLLWQELDKKHYQEAGFPQMGLARVGITEDGLLMSPKMQTSSVGRVNPTGEFLYGPQKKHNTYNRQIPGEYRGELEDVPLQLLQREFFEKRRSGGFKTQDDQRSLVFQSNTTMPTDQQMVDEVNTYKALIDDFEKEQYLRSLPSGGGPQPDRKIIRFGDTGGPPLDDQMGDVFGPELEIGTSKFNVENPEVVLKNHSLEDLESIDLSRSSAGGPSKNAKINAPIEEGAEKSIRLNLSSKIDPDGPPAPFNRLQTVHPVNSKGNPVYGKADSYMPAVTVEKGTFHVDQNRRRAIAEDGMKVPAMSVQGKVTSQRNVLNEMDDTVVEVGINPMDKHLFIDMKTGQAVKGFDIATVYRDRVYAKGVEYWKKADAPAPLPAKGDSPINNQVRYKFNLGGLMTAQ